MTRVISQFPRMSGGVTQRPLREQRMNQLLAMENMVLDPVMGLSRRPGVARLDSLPDGQSAEPGSTWRTHHVETDDNVLSFVYPVTPSAETRRAVVVDHTAGTVKRPVVRPDDPLWAAAMANGFGSVTNVGDLIVATVKGSTPSYTTARPWAAPANQKQLVVWCRGGAHSRTFTIKLLRGNQRVLISYTTLVATYPAILDTSDILPTDPDYSKKVNDRTNVYNSQANAWVADALADIAPENIVTKLAETLSASGFLSPGATATTDGPYLIITDPQIEEVEADDGGDGNLLRAVGNTVGAPELLTVNGYPGKIVKVRPGQSERGEVFYLKAVSKDGSKGKYTPVTWEECAGEVFTPTANMVYLVVAGGVPYASSDLAWLNAQAGREFVGWRENISGDAVSNPPPEFYGKAITAMAVFQDRLLVTLAGGYVAASQPGDYFNFYRDSAITVLDSDPVTFFIVGGEGDTVRHFVSYDRNLLMVGDKRQYLINGRTPLTTGTAAAAVFSAVPGMATVKPAVVAGDLFFARKFNAFGSMHTLRPGRVAETPYVTEVTEHVNNYIQDTPVEIVALTTPDLMVLRGSAGDSLTVANYEHVEGEQRYAVHRWTFAYGYTLMAIMGFQGSLHLVFSTGDGSVMLGRMRFQTAAAGAPTRHYDEAANSDIVQFVSKVTPVAARLSPEAGNVTATGFGVGAEQSFQRQVIGYLDLYFEDTGAAGVRVSYKTSRPARQKYYEVL